MAAGTERHQGGQYRRDGFTWAAFGALGGFGFLNAILGPAPPYIRASEHISYVVGAAHQVAFAVGGGLAGLFAARVKGRPGRAVTIRLGLVAAAVAGLGVGYGGQAAVTVVSALFVSLLGTSALIRLWAALSDAHAERRTVAMTEGEVSVSLGGIVAPLLVGGLAGTALGWRFAFVVGAAMVAVAAAVTAAVRIPPWLPNPSPGTVGISTRSGWLTPTLVVVVAVVALEFSLSFWLASYVPVDFPDGVVDVDERQGVGAGQQPRHRRGESGQDPGVDGVELPDVPERERAQERAQRRRRPHPREHLPHAAVAQHVEVIDAVRAGEHPGDHAGRLRCRIR